MESNFQRDDMLVVNGGKEPPEADRMASMIFEDICAALNIRRGTPFYQFLFRAAKRPALQFAEVLRSGVVVSPPRLEKKPLRFYETNSAIPSFYLADS